MAKILNCARDDTINVRSSVDLPICDYTVPVRTYYYIFLLMLYHYLLASPVVNMKKYVASMKEYEEIRKSEDIYEET